MSVPSISKRTIFSELSGVRSGFRTDVRRARAFRRRLFVESHALALGELIEAALYSTAMEEPLLPAIVTNEAEATIANEPFDSAVWHCLHLS